MRRQSCSREPGGGREVSTCETVETRLEARVAEILWGTRGTGGTDGPPSRGAVGRRAGAS